MTVVEAFKEGRVEGLTGKPEYVETVLSHVFLYPEEVYKIYRDDAPMIEGDRRASFEADFRWNQHFSPSVYLGLVGASLVDGQVVFHGDEALVST